MKTVRHEALETMRALGLTTIFGNPGSTEISFLADLPGDIRFVLGLHEGSVVGIAAGYAIARGKPAFVNLHTAAGLGNAVNAIATARDCRAPLVVVVGQQDRRQIAHEPFLTGRQLERLAGEYPVWSSLPVRAQDVPGAIARAYHEAVAGSGPALVVVPMGDWTEPADEFGAGSPERVLRSASVAAEQVDELAALICEARSPALVVGMCDTREQWDAIAALAERLRCPVWQEPFVRRAGFPQDHPLFAGHLPWRRGSMRRTLSAYDTVVAIGTGAFRLYLFDEATAVIEPDTRVAVITENQDEAHRSPSQLALVGSIASACAALAAAVPRRDGDAPEPMRRPPAPPAPEPGAPLTAGHVFAGVAQRLAADAVVIEESPSTQPELYQRIPIREPLGFVSTANGGLGFGISGAIGLRMGLPHRPVVALLGDGSSIYAIQAVWSAAQYGVGVLLIVLANGGYAIMDKLAQDSGGAAPWPSFGGVDISAIARGFGCPALRVETYEELERTLDDVIPGLAERSEPLLLEVAVAP